MTVSIPPGFGLATSPPTNPPPAHQPTDGFQEPAIGLSRWDPPLKRPGPSSGPGKQRALGGCEICNRLFSIRPTALVITTGRRRVNAVRPHPYVGWQTPEALVPAMLGWHRDRL